MAYVTVDGQALDIAIGANGDVLIIGTNALLDGTGFGIWRFNAGSGKFEDPGFVSGGRAIAVDANGCPWVIRNDGFIWRYTAGAGWSKFAQQASAIAIGASGDVFIIGPSSEVRKFNGTTFDPFTGSGLEIAVAAGGHPWIVNTTDIGTGDHAGDIWRFDSTWLKVAGRAHAVGAGGTDVFVIGTNALGTPTDPNGDGFGVWKFDGTAGFTFYGIAGRRIAVTSSGNPWLVTASGRILRPA